MNVDDIAKIVFFCSDLDTDISIKDYLKELLLTLWREEEGFSGKRPFGNSGWKYDIYSVLVNHNIISGATTEDGYLATCDRHQGNFIIEQIIERLDIL